MCSGVIYMLDIQKNHSEECIARSEWRYDRSRSSPAGVSVVPEQEDEGDVEAGGPVVLYVRGAGEDRADPCAAGVDGIRISGVVS